MVYFEFLIVDCELYLEPRLQLGATVNYGLKLKLTFKQFNSDSTIQTPTFVTIFVFKLQ